MMYKKMLPIFAVRLMPLVVLSMLFPVNGNCSDVSLPVSINKEPPQRAAKTTFLVGFAQDTQANDWRVQQVLEVKRALAPHSSIRFLEKYAHGKPARQVMDIENLITQGVDVLITSPLDSNILTPVISRAYQQGIPVILLDRNIESEDFTTFIGSDNRAIARQAANFLLKKHPEGGRILMLKGVPNATPTIDRAQGFVEEISRYRQFKIVAEKPANYLRGDAVKAVEEVVASGLQFDIIYAHSDSMATGARLALRHAGIDLEKITIIGIDYVREARQAIRNGEQAASFTYPTGGREGAKYALAILNGETVPKKVIIESVMVTPQNVEQVKPIF